MRFINLLTILCLLTRVGDLDAAELTVKPNVVLILADDLGWTDLSCYGSDLYQSPQLDRLARDGMRFTANYSACTVCSPTRAALLTGKYPARLHITDWIPGQPGTLDELKIDDRTIILFTSDNGGRVPTTSNAPLRVGKGSCYEGGVRVPLIIHWPNNTAANSICDVPVISMDIYPTILEMLGLPSSSGHRVDGVSLVPLLRQSGPLPDRALYWHYPHYQHYQQGGTTPYGAIRRGDHRLIEFYHDFRVELYNLRDDPSELRNLSAAAPDLVNRLREELHLWRQQVQAQMPTLNPAHDPTKPEHIPTPAKKSATKPAGTTAQG